ncbi:hypothetical protein [Sporomusa malonica]|uniref:Uncharacterized protein n=1 Tax=Sporomusa malonica TaxID=112901 RepID=A0A1W2B3U0_9FIRM|nr:hypothetical protein [Sporomusa malonica]SMC67401.1 hypothetical protein SAMN04488500_106293 [Sporomusa malonica]
MQSPQAGLFSFSKRGQHNGSTGLGIAANVEICGFYRVLLKVAAVIKFEEMQFGISKTVK